MEIGDDGADIFLVVGKHIDIADGGWDDVAARAIALENLDALLDTLGSFEVPKLCLLLHLLLKVGHQFGSMATKDLLDFVNALVIDFARQLADARAKALLDVIFQTGFIALFDHRLLQIETSRTHMIELLEELDKRLCHHHVGVWSEVCRTIFN